MPSLFSVVALSADTLLWVAIILALISLVASLAALRRTRHASAGIAESADAGQTQYRSSSASTAITAQAGLANDPALIAVLSAAVAMMLADSRPLTSSGKPAAASVAGFTIRKVRRV